MKYITVLLLTFAYNIYSQTAGYETLYTDKNGVILSYSISKTKYWTKCSRTPEGDANYSNKKIWIWAVDLKFRNNSTYTIAPKLDGIARISTETNPKISPVTYCYYNHTNNLGPNPGNGEQSIKSWPIDDLNRYVFKPGESINTTAYLYLYEGTKPYMTDWHFSGYNIVEKNETKDDDFWNGKNEKDNEKESNNNGFWNGGNDKGKITFKKNDFWTGKGNNDEESKFEENTKPVESDQFIGNVKSHGKSIRIFCWDTGQQDGDLVRIINNGITVANQIYLKNNGESYWFDLKYGQNRIEIIALNQGNVGSNTAAFKVFDEKGNLLAEKDWNLKTGFKGKLLILKL